MNTVAEADARSDGDDDVSGWSDWEKRNDPEYVVGDYWEKHLLEDVRSLVLCSILACVVSVSDLMDLVDEWELHV